MIRLLQRNGCVPSWARLMNWKEGSALPMRPASSRLAIGFFFFLRLFALALYLLKPGLSESRITFKIDLPRRPRGFYFSW